MQTELIIVSEYCHKCHIEPSFIELLHRAQSLALVVHALRGQPVHRIPQHGLDHVRQPLVLLPHRRHLR